VTVGQVRKNMEAVKQCFKCRTDKPLSEFYAHPMMADGHLNKCKDCAKADVKSNYATRRGQYSEYERRRNHDPSRRKKKAEYLRGHRSRNPQKAFARSAVSNAIRDGRLVKGACEVCGDPNTQAHHDDYSRPLDVRWLCFKHHREEEHGQVVTVASDQVYREAA
jgi:hypothetical protein